MARLQSYCPTPLVLLALSTLSTAPASLSETNLRLERHDNGFLFLDAERPVLFHQLKPKSLNGQSERANYIHPLYGLDGEILTEDFPVDHIHHRGIFWAWHQVLVKGHKISDSWLNRNFLAHVVEATPISPGDDSVAIQVRSEWVSPALTDTTGKQMPGIPATVQCENQNPDL